MATSWSDVLAIAPELSSVGDASAQAFLAMAEAQVNPVAWGDLRDAGVRYLAAHLATIASSGGRGPITAESVGSLSRSYAAPASALGPLAQTPYGVEYLRLTRLLPTVLGAVF